jgi:hypothetical protein
LLRGVSGWPFGAAPCTAQLIHVYRIFEVDLTRSMESTDSFECFYSALSLLHVLDLICWFATWTGLGVYKYYVRSRDLDAAENQHKVQIPTGPAYQQASMVCTMLRIYYIKVVYASKVMDTNALLANLLSSAYDQACTPEHEGNISA